MDFRLNPERVRLKEERFQRFTHFFIADPGLSLRSNRWAEISKRLRRIDQSYIE
jgi:hypothetical protein